MTQPIAVPTSIPTPPKSNSYWHVYNDSSTVVIFVHGILSDSKICWTCQIAAEGTRTVYWPDLVSSDARLGHPSIFMGGYTTFPGSGDLVIRDAARELLDSLRIADSTGRQSALGKPILVFVCHSTGGIVVRYMLERNQDVFKDKLIGLVLIASPSYGSLLANQLSALMKFYHQELGLQLQWGGESLDDLDGRFKDVIDKRRLRIHGIEAYEHYFVLRRWFLPQSVARLLPNSGRRVVSKLSAGRYFGDPKLLPETDHFSTAKPDSQDHVAHRLLVEFFTDFDRHRQALDDQLKPANTASVSEIFESVDRIRTATGSLGQLPFEVERVRRRVTIRYPDAVLEVSEDLVNVSSTSQSTTTLTVVTDAPVEFTALEFSATVTADGEPFIAPLKHDGSKDGRRFFVHVSFRGHVVKTGGRVHLDWSCRLPSSVARNEDYWVFPGLDLRVGGELIIEAAFPQEPTDAALFRITDHMREQLPLPKPTVETDLQGHTMIIYRSSHSEPLNPVYVFTWRLT